MNTRILNREGKLPSDGFYQIEAVGEHINHRARVVQVIDDKAITSIVNRFNAEAEANPDFAGLRIDRDHLSQSENNPTESLGWTMQLRNRDGIPEAKIDWTALGRPLIESKEGQPPVYKFFSTEYDSTQCEEIGTRKIRNREYKVLRPLRLDGLSLTNDPNNKGQRPISNRQGDEPDAGNHQPDPPTMKLVNKELGLAEDAPEASTLAEVQKIKNRAAAIEAERAALKTERDSLLEAQVEADLTKYAPRIKNRDAVKKQLLANRAGTLELLEAMQAVNPPTRITNRATAENPGSETGNPADPKAKEEDERAARISNRALEIQKQKSTRGHTYPYQSAFNDARAEIGVGK